MKKFKHHYLNIGYFLWAFIALEMLLSVDDKKPCIEGDTYGYDAVITWVLVSVFVYLLGYFQAKDN